MTDESRRALSRRAFLGTTVGAVSVAAAIRDLEAQGATDRPGGGPPAGEMKEVPPSIKALKPMTAGIVPISDEERKGRIEKARRLMHDNRIGAVMLEGGSSLYYFTGVRWGNSERPFVCVIPASGDIAWICPAFEEARAKELIHFGADIRTWEEDQSPYERIAQVFKDRGVASGKIGVEERLRFFIVDGVRQVAPALEFVSADPVTAGCRMIKSPAELALMKRANEITLASYKAAAQTLHEGMPLQEFRRNVYAAYQALGVDQAAVLASFGKYTAFPHGSTAPQQLREGDMVLVDDGCTIDGYQADVTRTWVFGKASQHQRDVWTLEKKAQAAAIAAVRPGVACGAIDAAARKLITDAGYGPGYKVPGLPHRTGHGIGLDGHEWPYLVRGNTLPLKVGMCFSDEPMITNYAEFGIRLEDCFHVTEHGGEFFTGPALSFERPFDSAT